MKSVSSLIFAEWLILALAFLSSTSGQLLFAKQLSQPYLQSGSGGALSPLVYAYNSAGAGFQAQPQFSLQPQQYGLNTLSIPTQTTAQYQFYPQHYQQLLSPSNVYSGNGYPLFGTGALPVPVKQDVMLEEPFLTSSNFASGSLPIQSQSNGGFMTLEPNVPVTSIVSPKLPLRNQIGSQGQQVISIPPPPQEVPAHLPLPVHDLEDEEEEEEIEETNLDAVLAALMAQAEKNGQTVHSDRYTYGRSEPVAYRFLPLLSLPELLYRYQGRGLKLKKRKPQRIIKKPFSVKLPHHFEFYDWH